MRNCLSRLKNEIRLKRQAENEILFKMLSDDTQIILKQFMERTDHYGETAYIVREKDVQAFDALIRNHQFKKLSYYGSCDLDYCVNENLKSGAGFIIFLNGEQYVAIRPPKPINADCFVKSEK